MAVAIKLIVINRSNNRCVMEVFGGVVVLSIYLYEHSVAIGTFVIGLESDLFLFSHRYFFFCSKIQGDGRKTTERQGTNFLGKGQ